MRSKAARVPQISKHPERDASLGEVFAFSPSQCHQHLLAGISPSCAYREGSVDVWQTQFAPRLARITGFAAMPRPQDRPALSPKILWQRLHPSGLGTIEKIVFHAEEGADVPAYFCVPAHGSAPYSVMICLQGHSTGMHCSIGLSKDDERTPIVIEGERDFALACMRRGLAALCIEQRSFGERAERVQVRRCYYNGCHDAAMRALLLGRTLLAERVYDVDRALDYLEQRGDVQMEKVGVMGISGGGTVAIYAGALLPRLRFMMAACSFCTLSDSIATIHHCADNYVPGLLSIADMPDVLGLFAPRPVVLIAGRHDAIFPLPGVRRAYRRLRAIYKAADAYSQCRLAVGEEGHRFYADLGFRAARRFLAAWTVDR